MSKVCLYQKTDAKYPSIEKCFRPGISYPELIFSEDVSNEPNDVYEMIRESFRMLGLDSDNFGTKKWNPLKNIVSPGDTVLIKPNMVLHANRNGCGTDCLFTHPSLVATVIDYVLIALKGTGKIVVGDSPLQDCDFDALVTESGYKRMIDFYKGHEINIELVDFRNVKSYEKDGLYYLQEDEGCKGKIVKLNEKSAFKGIGDEAARNLRITNYDPRILQSHHNAELHEYNVSEYVLSADVIINMPKPKTHRKAGVTISLKNLVGINANKEFLPHHMIGSIKEGGDAYEKENYYLTKANEILDLKNELIHNKDFRSASVAKELYEHLYSTGMAQSGERYWEGSWYGNNTIWKTIVDLNRILLYADKNGIIRKERQRKLFIVGDMVISGHKEGPLEPVPISTGLVVVGKDPVFFDRVVCSVMGFDYKLIPSLAVPDLFEGDYPISIENQYSIVSNNSKWDKNSCENIADKYSFEFIPTAGWNEKLGNKYYDRLCESLSGKKVYVFGAGVNGKYAANLLKECSVEVIGFLDNNHELWEKEIEEGLYCFPPQSIEKGTLVVAGVRDAFIPIIEEEILNIGGKYCGAITV